MKIVLFIILVLGVLYIATFNILAIQSQYSRKQMGLVFGSLRPCPDTPNCVSSEEKGKPCFIEPLAFKGDPGKALMNLKQAVQTLGGTIERTTDNYIWATFRTKFWHFTDDTEFLLDKQNGIIRVRSASRVGKGDMGQNRKRVEALRQMFNSLQAKA